MGLYDTFGKASKPDSNPGVRPIELYMCSVVKRMGYADGGIKKNESDRTISNAILPDSAWVWRVERADAGRDGTAEPVPRDQTLGRERGHGEKHFSCSADHERIDNHTG